LAARGAGRDSSSSGGAQQMAETTAAAGGMQRDAAIWPWQRWQKQQKGHVPQCQQRPGCSLPQQSIFQRITQNNALKLVSMSPLSSSTQNVLIPMLKLTAAVTAVLVPVAVPLALLVGPVDFFSNFQMASIPILSILTCSTSSAHYILKVSRKIIGYNLPIARDKCDN
jgi:hypothetical protein